MSYPEIPEVHCDDVAWEINKPKALLEFYDDPDDLDSMIITLEEVNRDRSPANTVTQITLGSDELSSLRRWLARDESHNTYSPSK